MPWRYPPPGGFAGFAEQTPASQSALTRGTGIGNGGGGRRRRKKKAKASAPKRRRKSSGKKRGGKLKKGSAAAKARMAKLRKMRKK